MAYMPVPKDLSKVKTKVLFNLTKRQLICFSGGALIGVPLFFLLILFSNRKLLFFPARIAPYFVSDLDNTQRWNPVTIRKSIRSS